MPIPMSPVSAYLRTMSDKEVLVPEPGVVLNELKCRRGFINAKRTDVDQERTRRRELANKDSEFQHHLITCQTELGFSGRELAAAYWAVRSELPCEQSFPRLAEVTGVSLDRLVECYERVSAKSKPTKPTRRRRSAAPKTPKVPKAPKIAPVIEGGKRSKSEAYSAETVTGVRVRALAGMSPSEIYNSQATDPLPGANGKILGSGLIRGYCTNERRPEVGWPGIGKVKEKFSGKKAEERAGAFFRGLAASLATAQLRNQIEGVS